MAQTKGEAFSLDDVDCIVDTDAHVTDTVDEIVPYIDEEFRGIRKTVENAHYPLRNIYSATHSLPVFQHSEYSSGRELFSEDAVASDRNAKLKEMEEFDIDYGILNPTLNLGIATVENTRVAVGLMGAYNSWITDTFLDDHEELKATAIVAPQKPDKAAEEIDRMAQEKDIVGIALPATGNVKPLGHHRFDPIYEAAQDHDMPIVIHGATGALSHTFPVQSKSNETYAEDHMISHPFSLIWNLNSMIFQGIPERFPDLQFNMQEGGIGWVPYTVWRLDDHHLALADENPFLEKLPSEYISDQFYFSTQPLGHTTNPKHMARAIEMAGPELIMFSSDLPHPDFDTPDELFDRVKGHFDEETVCDMMGGTAIDVFDL